MIRFSHPYLLFLLFIIPVMLLGEFIFAKIHFKGLTKLANERNFRLMADIPEKLIIHLRKIMIYTAMVFLIIALSGPQIGTALEEIKREGVDIIVAIDVSLSMQAEDVKPNRLMRAKYEVSRLIDNLRGDRIGLIVFAGVSYLQCPLTLDYGAAKLFLDIIDTKLIGTQGTSIKDALQTASDAFGEDRKRERIVIFLSDGEDHEGNLDKAINIALDSGIRVYGVGVGTISGAPIPLNDEKGTSFKKDRSGHVVTTALKEDFLYRLAEETGGKYYRLLDSPMALNSIYKEILQKERETFTTHQYSQFEERYQYFLFGAILLLIGELMLPEIRKRKNYRKFDKIESRMKGNKVSA